MGTIQHKIHNWPRTRRGELIFKSSEEAYFYAALIYTNKIFIGEVRKTYRTAREEFKQLSKRTNVNLDRLALIACKTQYTRECLQEVQRLQDQELKNKVKQADEAGRREEDED